jgi:hypothetical protein
VDPYPEDHCGSPVDLQLYQLPGVDSHSCDLEDAAGGGTYYPDPDGIPGHWRAIAGTFDRSFPDSTLSAGVLKLESGIYCLNAGISFSAQWTVTTDLDGNGVFDRSDGANEGVLLYVPNGAVTFNGGTDVHIGAMNNTDVPETYRGYLLYLPPTNDSPVKIAGNNGSTFIGTILAPSSLITLEGGSATDSLNLECQIIGYSDRITGGGYLNISYYEDKVAQGWTNPILEPFR